MKKQIRVLKSTETVSIYASDTEGTYRVVWHRTEGPAEEFTVTPGQDEEVEEAVRRDLKNRLGP